MVEFQKFGDLSASLKETLSAMSESEFGQVPIVKSTQWSPVDWTLIKKLDGEIVAFCNLVLRRVSLDQEVAQVAGVNNVITPARYRGMGYGSELMQELESFIFFRLKVDHGLLLCSDDLIPFYQKLGWYAVQGDLFYSQPEGRRQWPARIMMLSPNRPVAPQMIDLRGRPW